MGLINLLHEYQLYKLLRNPALSEAKWWLELYNMLYGIEEVRVTLAGYKTYIVAAATAALSFAHMMGWITDQLYAELLGLLGSMGLATMAAKVNRLNK